MPTEIEAKLKVDSLHEVERRLAGCGASFASETVQTDSYFDTADRKLTHGDECLRLRVEREGEKEQFFFTYKGAREESDFKRRREINLDVGRAEDAESLLGALGYHRVLVFNKKRRTWRLNECDVALDELPLIGVFVEIEGPSADRISLVQHALDLDDVPHVDNSYASLIARRLSQLGLEQGEVFL